MNLFMADAISPGRPVLTGLAHIGIRVHDFERAMRFYALLGFELAAGPFETRLEGAGLEP